ncbi:MAG: 16S rRNA (uracil(1498)-N(3))-methyltransferase [Thermoguttaceae bacterium]
MALAVKAGWRAVQLGPRLLRVETAALTLAGLAAGCFGRRSGAESPIPDP